MCKQIYCILTGLPSGEDQNLEIQGSVTVFKIETVVNHEENVFDDQHFCEFSFLHYHHICIWFYSCSPTYHYIVCFHFVFSILLQTVKSATNCI